MFEVIGHTRYDEFSSPTGERVVRRQDVMLHELGAVIDEMLERDGHDTSVTEVMVRRIDRPRRFLG